MVFKQERFVANKDRILSHYSDSDKLGIRFTSALVIRGRKGAHRPMAPIHSFLSFSDSAYM